MNSVIVVVEGRCDCDDVRVEISRLKYLLFD
jgi:hypothetical protein